MLELLIYFLVLGPFMMNDKEKNVFAVVVVAVVAFFLFGSLFYK